MDRVDALRVARERVLERIADACARAGRKPSDVTLLAVSKTFGPDVVRDAVAAGLDQFGENRVQEASAKVGEVAGSTWHLVGPLQANKARKALEVFASIQTVDSIPLAERLDRISGELRPGARYPVLLQVNVDDDPAKAGFGPDRLADACARLAGCDALEIRGLMTIGRLVDSAEAARTTFRKLREIAEALRAAGHQIGPDLSMGMTDDFDVAVEEGATIVRVGRALFGERHLHDHDGPADQVHDSATRGAVSRA